MDQFIEQLPTNRYTIGDELVPMSVASLQTRIPQGIYRDGLLKHQNPYRFSIKLAELDLAMPGKETLTIPWMVMLPHLCSLLKNRISNIYAYEVTDIFKGRLPIIFSQQCATCERAALCQGTNIFNTRVAAGDNHPSINISPERYSQSKLLKFLYEEQVGRLLGPQITNEFGLTLDAFAAYRDARNARDAQPQHFIQIYPAYSPAANIAL